MSYVKPYSLYYSSANDAVYTAERIEKIYGFDPSQSPASILPEYGVYKVNQVEPYESDLFYDLEADYTIVGIYAEQSWVATAKGLSKVKNEATKLLKSTTAASILAAVAQDDYAEMLLIAIASVAAASRKPAFTDPLDVMKVQSDELGEQLASIDVATTVDEIQDITFPPTSVTGTIAITRTGNDLDLAEYSVGPVGLDPNKIKLIINGTTYNYDDATDEYPATSSAFSGSPYYFELRYSIYTLVSGEVTTDGAPQDFPFSWTPAVTPPTKNA